MKNRRKNAELFVRLFENHKDFIIQKEIGESSWFGFSLIIRPESNIVRKNVVKLLQNNGIDCRPIVTGDFTQNEVMKYFDFEIHNELKNAQYLHENGLFVGNQQVLIGDNIKFLFETLLKLNDNNLI